MPRPEAVDSHFGNDAGRAAPVELRAPDGCRARGARDRSPAPIAGRFARIARPSRRSVRRSFASAAAAGDPAAAFEVAARYAEGNGVRPDLAKAAEWYRKAAEAGLAVAQYRLGSLYERGQGVTKDPATAVAWYQHAADQGNVGAMHNLAVMMSEGVDGAPDHDKALRVVPRRRQLRRQGQPVQSRRRLCPRPRREAGPRRSPTSGSRSPPRPATRTPARAATRSPRPCSPDELAKARATIEAWRATPPIAEANTVATPAGGWEGAAAGVTDADQPALVKKIQTLLAEQGYDPGPADGVEGPKTPRCGARLPARRVGMSETGRSRADSSTALAEPAD